jgi:Tfp pilus assembly protein PilX
MQSRARKSKGFTLITTLLLLFLLSGLAIGMLMMVNTEVKVGTQDVQNNVTFHAAEGAMEKMTADIANLFTTDLSPNPQDIANLSTAPGPPVLTGITFPAGGYTLTPVTNPPGCTGVPPACKMVENPGTVVSGPFAGLSAQLLQVNLQATAQGVLGDEVQMSRTVEVAMIPVFQFGVFSDGDLAFFNNPTLTFNGRIHTNGDLYLGCVTGATCTFTNKLSAYGNVIRAVVPNGLGVGAIGDQGNVLIPGEPNGCSGLGECTTLPTAGDLWGSVIGAGGNPPASAYNGSPTYTPDWVKKISEGTWTAAKPYLGGMLLDGNYGNAPNSGATNLSLPFVNGATLSQTPGLGNPPGPQNYEIVRRPPPGELTTTPIGASRLYNQAAIRILLSDRPEELPGGAADADNVRLANIVSTQGNGNDYHLGVPTTIPAARGLTALPGGLQYTTYFATASTAIPNPGTSNGCPGAPTQCLYYADWLYAPKSVKGEYNQEFQPLDEGAPYSVPISQTVVNAASGISNAPGTATMQKNTYPYYSPVPTLNLATATADTQWNLIDGYLRVEFLPQTAGVCPGPGALVNGYCAITREWLSLGFARDVTPPTAPGAGSAGYIACTPAQQLLPLAPCSNDVNPYAILILQQPAKRNTGGWTNTGFGAVGVPDQVGSAPTACNAGGTNCTNGRPPEVTYDATLNALNGSKYPYYSECTGTGVVGAYCTAGAVSNTAFNWYPINFYDAREGEPNDVVYNNNTCTPQGVLNAVELDVGNLTQWLAGTIPGSGTKVNYTNQNGYVLYFSDRRGMLPNPNGTQTIGGGLNPLTNISGDAGFEDVVNRTANNRVPDGALDPPPAGKLLSPEDANLNGRLDNFGAQNLGLGFGYVPTPAAPPAAASAYPPAGSVTVNSRVYTNPLTTNPYLANGTRMTCSTAGATATSVVKNAWISGARHVLKLVDGSLGNLPTVPGGVFPLSSGGFTVGSENPVYVLGNYNSNCPAAGPGNGCTTINLVTNLDPSWPPPFGPGGADPKHAAASIVADTVTLLSNNWLDWNSILLQPTQPCPNGTAANTGCGAGTGTGDNRAAVTSFYRTAIATGDVQAFASPAWATAADIGIGTDGGVGNFLRMLESWGAGKATVQTLNYNGSMVNLFFSTYSTGIFKCCQYSVYFPPDRDYNFDVDFTTFSELPPGTPMFRDIDNMSYRQSFNPCTVAANGLCGN